MIRAFGRMNRAHDAVLFFKRMREEEKEDDSLTFCFLINISSQLMDISLATSCITPF
jgi:pentatricopeptide repeat protein